MDGGMLFPILAKALLLLAHCLDLATALSLSEVVKQQRDLSAYYGYLTYWPAAERLANLTNITVLAPTDDAWLQSSYVQGQGTPSGNALIGAVMQYHALQGAYRSTDFNTSWSFMPTCLDDPDYTNVTGGQKLEVYYIGNDLNFISGGAAEAGAVIVVSVFLFPSFLSGAVVLCKLRISNNAWAAG